MRRNVGFLALGLLPCVLGCGADLDFKQARYLEDSGQYARAAKAYEAFLRRRPEDPRIAEVLYRAGSIHASRFGRCAEASDLLERAARLPPGTGGPWPERARNALMDCPDFFPLKPGSEWTYVDTASGGRNMRLEIRLSSSTETAAARLSGAYFAGKKRFRAYDRLASKEEWAIWESEGSSRLPILTYPFRAGRSWTGTEGGKRVRFSIERDSLRVATRAGAFSGCLKVKRHSAGAAAWVYDYYCPGVGRVKTTIGIPGGENPNTELAAYEASGNPSSRKP